MLDTIDAHRSGPQVNDIRDQQPALYRHTLGIRALASAGLIIGLVALVGWLGDWPLLKSVLPGSVEMKANTALGLMATGGALWMLDHRRSSIFYITGQVLALFAVVLGLATLGQYLFGWRLGIDEWLFVDSHGKYATVRGRMSPYTALAFTSIGLALLMLSQGRLRKLATWPAAITLIIGLLSALGYAWNASELTTDVFLPPVAVNTAVALIFLSTGTLLAIGKAMVQQATTAFSMNSMEGKIFMGFAGSFLLLTVGAGMTYQATTIFASSAQQVAHTQQVRAALGQLYRAVSDTGLAQRTYLITGRVEQIDEYHHQQAKVVEKSEQLRLLVSDNASQMENLASLQPLIDETRGLLDQGIALYQQQGFGAAKQLVDSGQGLVVMNSLFAVLQRMDGVEEALLTEREAASAGFQRYMLISMLLTMGIAACIFAALYREIRREVQARHLTSEALHIAKNAAERLRQEAETANHAKSTFLATMSHEIRTPMNGMLGMLELLSLTALDGSQRATLKVVRESGKTLMRIIDDILDFSKIEAHKLDIHPEPTHLGSLLEDIRNTYSSNASSKGLPIICRVDDKLSPAVMVDPVRLRQIIHNLVSNAIKFTASGQIDITADLIERSAGSDRVRFCVKDTGIGISEIHQKRLFQPFAQAELNTARRYGGTGLGLSISKRLAGLLGGAIDMLSAPGQGTTVVLELSLPIADPALLAPRESTARESATLPTLESRRAAPSVAQAEAEGTLVLLADDHPTNRLLLMRQLNLLGYAAESATNGLEALEMWKQGRYKLVLTDCNMPEMNGYELARSIRAIESSGSASRCPIIACTANAMGGEAAICLEAGMDDYIAKPVELKRLLPKLEHWLPLPLVPPATPPAVPPPTLVVHRSTAGLARCPIDHVLLARMSSGDAELEREIFKEFQRATDDDAQSLAQAVTDRDSAQVKSLAHLIKGASAMVGATQLSTICERIEHANHRGDWHTVVASLTDFHQEVERLNHYFAQVHQTGQLTP